MSIINSDGVKILLPRNDPDAFWQLVLDDYAGRDRQVWRRLAMLALRESAGWPIDRIAVSFNQDTGHVSRSLSETKRDLRTRFRLKEND